MLRILPFLLILPLLVSTKCFKPRNTTSIPTVVEGVVLRYGDDKPIEGQWVVLSAQSKSSAWTPNTDTSANAVQTDADGKFRFDFKASEDYFYKVGLYHQTEEYGRTNQIEYVDAGEDRFDLRFHLAAMGIVAVHLINEPPLDTLETISFSNGGAQSYYNISSDTSLYLLYPSGIYTLLSYYLRKNEREDGVNQNDSIFIPIADTFHKTILY